MYVYYKYVYATWYEVEKCLKSNVAGEWSKNGNVCENSCSSGFCKVEVWLLGGYVQWPIYECSIFVYISYMGMYKPFPLLCGWLFKDAPFRG